MEELANRERLVALRSLSTDPATNKVIEEIYDAFQGVSRMRAMSWNDADIADSYGTTEGHFPDTDSTWEELVKASWWYGDFCFGFLDPEGARYYLPAAMICNLLGDYRVVADYPLERPEQTFGEVEQTLSERQVRAIQSFLRHRVELAALRGSVVDFEDYSEIESKWALYYTSS